MDGSRDPRRRLPAVHQVLEAGVLPELRRVYGHAPVKEAVEAVLARLRARLAAPQVGPGGAGPGDAGEGGGRPEAVDGLSPADVARLAAAEVERAIAPSLRRVVNATGVVIHTNLGRAVLSPAARRAVAEVAGAYSNLEFDLASGERGSRHDHVEALLRRLTGAEAAMVVNNNAAAVFLALMALAAGREVVVSRGELVEIGGSFRIPDVMAQSGARLVEVGTTNKTRPDDYRRAIGPDTALLLKVHPSNYRIVGFTAAVTLEELVGIGREAGLPVMYDLGSGALIPLDRYGLKGEPVAGGAIAAGVALVTFSGDKLLGGPQAGVIAGRRDLVDRCRRHPLARALRVDKMTLAALEATLKHYLDPEKAAATVPVLRMLTLTPEELAARADDLAAKIRGEAGDAVRVTLSAGVSQVGGGSLPGVELPTTLVAVEPVRLSVPTLAARLRRERPAVVGRVEGGRLLLDPRTLLPGDAAVVAAAVARAVRAG